MKEIKKENAEKVLSRCGREPENPDEIKFMHN